MSRKNWLFAAVVAVPLATLGMAALPSSGGSTINLAAASQASHHHHHWRSGSPSPSASDPGSASASPSDSPTGTGSASPSPSPTATGPTPDEFVDIRQVQPNASAPASGAQASRGSFVAHC